VQLTATERVREREREREREKERERERERESVRIFKDIWTEKKITDSGPTHSTATAYIAYLSRV
jgi:uncharacterized Zn finger protein (UPF0148 family)